MILRRFRLLPEAFIMRKLLPLMIIFALFAPAFSVKPVAASAESKTMYLQTSQLENVFTFDKLGYLEKLLVGPFDSTSINFSLPANVKLATGSSLLLKYALAWSGGGVSADSVATGVG